MPCKCRDFVTRLLDLRHFNGQPLCKIYGWHDAQSKAAFRASRPGNFSGEIGQGPTVALNFLTADGSYVGYR